MFRWLILTLLRLRGGRSETSSEAVEAEERDF